MLKASLVLFNSLNTLAHLIPVRRFRSADKGGLLVGLEPEPAEPVVVSPERAAAFRAWRGARA